MVRDVLADAVRPAVEARLLDHVELDAALRAAGRIGVAGVRAVVAHQHPAGLLVDVDPERVPESHREDLGQRLVAGVLGLREQVAIRDRVRRADARDAGGVRDRLDAQDLAVGIVRVGRGPLRVPGLAAGALVSRVEAVRERVGVVAGREVERAVGPEVERAATCGSTAHAGAPGVDHLLLPENVAGQREARDAVDAETVRVLVRQRRVGQIDMAGRREVRRELDAEQAVLVDGSHRDGPDHRARLALR